MIPACGEPAPASMKDGDQRDVLNGLGASHHIQGWDADQGEPVGQGQASGES